MKLRNKTALITGASQGIGRAIAETFVREGAKVAINDIANHRAAEETKRAIENQGGEAVLIRADIGKSDQIAHMFATCLKKLGHLDILVNNASIECESPFWQLEEEQWDRTMSVNLKSIFLCSQHAASHMMPRGQGKILNISSIHDVVPRPRASIYCASKAALLMLTKVYALELAPYNIQVNALSPGLVHTNRSGDFVETHEAEIQYAIPARRAGLAQEIAEAALYFVSDHSNYTTGTTAYIDGGYMLNVTKLLS